MSKLEISLYRQMHLLSLAEGSTFPMPVREFHPFWCCEHPKRAHDNPAVCPPPLECALCEGQAAVHDYHHGRAYRCDFAWPEQRVILEVEGAVWTQGRHTRGSGFLKDMVKYNALTEAGWAVYRVSQREITSGEALRIIERVLVEVAS